MTLLPSRRYNSVWLILRKLKEVNSVKKRLRILLAVFCILTLPMVLTNESANSASQYIAIAGHTSVGGRYCGCGPEDCICEPGEQATSQPTDTQTTDAPTGAMVLLLIVLLGLRLRP